MRGFSYWEGGKVSGHCGELKASQLERRDVSWDTGTATGTHLVRGCKAADFGNRSLFTEQHLE